MSRKHGGGRRGPGPQRRHLRPVDPTRKDGHAEVSPQQEALLNQTYAQAKVFLMNCRVEATKEEIHTAAFRAAQDLLGLQQAFVMLARPCPRPFHILVVLEQEPVLSGADWRELATLVIDARGTDASLYDLHDDADRERFVMTHAATGIVTSTTQRAMLVLRKIRMRIEKGADYAPPKAPAPEAPIAND